MKNKSVAAMKPLSVICLLASIIFTLLTGCVSEPVLLRNRVNVPPPVAEPGTDLQQPGSEEIIENTPVVAVPVIVPTNPLPPPDIKTAPVTYTVVKNDTFWKISRMYGVTQKELATVNNLSLDKPLRVGTVLLIPPGGAFIPPEKRAKVKKHTVRNRAGKPVVKHKNYTPSSSDGTYVVQPHDTLWGIARKYNTTTAKLAQANNLDIKRPLKIGQKLVIPGAAGKIAGTSASSAEVTNEQPVSHTEMKVSIELPKPVSEADELLKDAESATDTPVTPEDSAVNLIDNLDNAAESGETDKPMSCYTEVAIPGDTLQSIADRNGLTPEQIRAANPDIPPDGTIKPFATIKIPK